MEVKNVSVRANEKFSNSMFLSDRYRPSVVSENIEQHCLFFRPGLFFFLSLLFFFNHSQQIYKEAFLPRNKAITEHSLKSKMCVSPIDCTQLLYPHSSWCVADPVIQPFLLVILIDLVLVSIRKLQRICSAAQQLGSRRWQLRFS